MTLLDTPGRRELAGKLLRRSVGNLKVSLGEALEVEVRGAVTQIGLSSFFYSGKSPKKQGSTDSVPYF